MGGDQQARNRLAAAALAIVTAAVVWHASTPQRDLGKSAYTRLAAPVLPQHWAYYTTKPLTEVYLPLERSGSRLHMDVPGRAHWWTFNISQRGIARLNAWAYVASQIPLGDWQSCTPSSCPSPTQQVRIASPPSSLRCGIYDLARLANEAGASVSPDGLLRATKVARVQLACAK